MGVCGFNMNAPCPDGWKFNVSANKTMCHSTFCSTSALNTPDTKTCCEECTADNPCPTTAAPSTTQGSTSQASGASSSSSGSSASTTQASSTPQKDTTVTGDMTMDITFAQDDWTDLAQFVQDDNVRQGFSAGIATRLSVTSPDTVTINDISVVAGRRLPDSRRLDTGKVKVDFLVTLKGMAPLNDFTILQGIEARLGNAEIYWEEMAAAIDAALEASTAKTLTVAVTELGDPTIVKGTGETSGGSSSDGSSSGVSSVEASAAWRASSSISLLMLATVCMASSLRGVCW